MKRTSKKTRRRAKPEPKLPVSVVTREGKTTVRQFDGRRFVEFREFQGKRVSRVVFYTAGHEHHSVNVRFQDGSSFYLTISPMFLVKPRYYRLRAGELETIKEWPEIRSEK
jgi:hypothetical protein